MIANEANDHAAYVSRAFDDCFANYNRPAFLRRCGAVCASVLVDETAARIVMDRCLDGLRSKTPLSLVRVGDGEGNILHFLRNPNAISLFYFNKIFRMMDGQAIAFEEATAFATSMSNSIEDADIIGLTSIVPVPDHLLASPGPTPSIVSVDDQLRQLKALAETNKRGAVGAIGAIDWECRALEAGVFRGKTIASAWINLLLLPYLTTLLAAADRVIVISGQKDLESRIRRRIGPRLGAFIDIPTQADTRETGEPRHYPERFDDVRKGLSVDLRGALVIVGAGVFGKVYCADAKRSGAVAIDLGSVLDVLAGRFSRSEHATIDIRRYALD